MKNCKINLIDKADTVEIYRTISTMPTDSIRPTEADPCHEKDLINCLSFAAYVDGECTGAITLNFPYNTNANIHRIEIDKSWGKSPVAQKLLMAAENYCYENGYSSLTITTIYPEEYEKYGFRPLLKMHTHDPDLPMACMQKNIRLDDFTFIDLTHSLNATVPNWDGDCGFSHKIKIDYADCETESKFRVHKINMHAGIGTHMDAPAHCIPGAMGISDIPLQSLISPSRIIDVSDRAHERYQVSTLDIEEHENEYGLIPKGTFVIIYTGWDKFWNDPKKYRNNLIFPSVSKEAAKKILSRNIIGIGIDTLSPDTGDTNFPVHQLMLNENKYIIENISNINKIRGKNGFIIALPLKIEEGTESPIRLVGMIKNIP